MEDCLSSIDDKLKECAVHVEDYKRSFANLAMIREELVQLDAEPSVMPLVCPRMALKRSSPAWRFPELWSPERI
jgi:hypothetical protein